MRIRAMDCVRASSKRSGGTVSGDCPGGARAACVERAAAPAEESTPVTLGAGAGPAAAPPSSERIDGYVKAASATEAVVVEVDEAERPPLEEPAETAELCAVEIDAGELGVWASSA
jgi:hypothetical protein